MRIFRILLFVAIFILSLQCKNSEQKPNMVNALTKNRLDSLFVQYKVDKIYVGLFFTNKFFHKEYLNTVAQINQNEDIYYCSLESDLIEYFSHNSNKLDSIEAYFSLEDINCIQKWCAIDQKLNSISITSDEGITFEEIIYKMKEGKEFYKEFIKIEGQYYGSLDFEQSCRLYYNVILYLIECSPQKLEYFFEEYIETYESLNN